MIETEKPGAGTQASEDGAGTNAPVSSRQGPGELPGWYTGVRFSEGGAPEGASGVETVTHWTQLLLSQDTRHLGCQEGGVAGVPLTSSKCKLIRCFWSPAL